MICQGQRADAAAGSGPTLALVGARTAAGASVDVQIAGGKISAVRCSSRGGAAPERDNSRHGEVLDLRGYLLLPSMAEPHAHLDKALLLARSPNPAGDLPGAVAAMRSAYPSMTPEDITARAVAACREAVAHGFTAIRTHADCGVGIGSRGVRALARLRPRLQGLVDIQIVAMARELGGPEGAENLAILEECMGAGADLVGGAPWRERDARRAMASLAAVARGFGCGLDLHVDETTEAGTFTLPGLIEVVEDAGLAGAVTASHAVSLGMQDPATVRSTALRLASSGISVVTLPQSNLYLQGRRGGPGQLRGLAPVLDLLAAGVTVAGGGDNWRDPFNPMGRIDGLETASLLVTAAHLDAHSAYALVSAGARRVMGLPAVSIAAGSPADLLAVRAGSIDEALAAGGPDRIVVKAGRVVSATTVRTESAGGWDLGGLAESP